MGDAAAVATAGGPPSRGRRSCPPRTFDDDLGRACGCASSPPIGPCWRCRRPTWCWRQRPDRGRRRRPPPIPAPQPAQPAPAPAPAPAATPVPSATPGFVAGGRRARRREHCRNAFSATRRPVCEGGEYEITIVALAGERPRRMRSSVLIRQIENDGSESEIDSQRRTGRRLRSLIELLESEGNCVEVVVEPDRRRRIDGRRPRRSPSEPVEVGDTVEFVLP